MNIFKFFNRLRERKLAKVDILPIETSFDTNTEDGVKDTVDWATEKQAPTDSEEELLKYLLDEGILTEEEFQLMIDY